MTGKELPCQPPRPFSFSFFSGGGCHQSFSKNHLCALKVADQVRNTPEKVNNEDPITLQARKCPFPRAANEYTMQSTLLPWG